MLEPDMEWVHVRCTINKRTNPWLYAELANAKASDRSELLRHYAGIGVALATNRQVLQLIGLAVGEINTAHGRKASERPTDAGPKPVAAAARPSDDYLDQLAGSVLTRA